MVKIENFQHAQKSLISDMKAEITSALEIEVGKSFQHNGRVPKVPLEMAMGIIKSTEIPGYALEALRDTYAKAEKLLVQRFDPKIIREVVQHSYDELERAAYGRKAA